MILYKYYDMSHYTRKLLSKFDHFSSNIKRGIFSHDTINYQHSIFKIYFDTSIYDRITKDVGWPLFILLANTQADTPRYHKKHSFTPLVENLYDQRLRGLQS